MARLLALILVGMSIGGCVDEYTLTCKTDRICVLLDETPGLCLKAPDTLQYCAFPAADCPSKWRWDKYAAGYRNQCVDPALIPVDGGVDGAPTDAGTDGAPADG